MKAKNIQDSKHLPNMKLLILLVFVAILAIFVKESFFEYYEKADDQAQRQNVEQNSAENSSEKNEDPVQCSTLYLEIEKLMDEMNHCAQDSDCDVLVLGADYIEFGCYHFIHKDENKRGIFEKMDEYNEKCNKIINECASSPSPRCVERVCISK